MVLGSACSGDDGGPEQVSLIPDSFPADFTEVRGCRRSGDHDFQFIKVLADANAVATYSTRTGPFPEGSVIIKEEYDPSDTMCENEVALWTVMVRLAEGEDPENLDWAWQKVYASGKIDPPIKGCANCHKDCGIPPDGYDGTCTLP